VEGRREFGVNLGICKSNCWCKCQDIGDHEISPICNMILNPCFEIGRWLPPLWVQYVNNLLECMHEHRHFRCSIFRFFNGNTILRTCKELELGSSFILISVKLRGNLPYLISIPHCKFAIVLSHPPLRICNRFVSSPIANLQSFYKYYSSYFPALLFSCNRCGLIPHCEFAIVLSHPPLQLHPLFYKYCSSYFLEKWLKVHPYRTT
jgi:hypothetical protein